MRVQVSPTAPNYELNLGMDYYAPWEWAPVENMPDGCNDVTVRYVDGTRVEYCSCDYWWNATKEVEQPVSFRLT